MKKLIYIALGLLTWTGCNVVDDPYGDNQSAGPGDEAFNDTVYNDTTDIRRRILLEDFTGHKCPNCPEGADIAEDIKDNNPKDVVSVAIHTGPFAKVDVSDPEKQFPSDFNTETGEALRIQYQIGSFPSGLLNRSQINGKPLVDYNQWATEVNNLLNDPQYMTPRFKINLTNIYNSKPDDQSIRVIYKVEALADLSGNYAMVVYLTENSIVAPQIDSRLPNSYVADYTHNHVLRKGFPSVGQGKTLFTDPQTGDIAEVVSEAEEISTTISEEWVADNMEVIVFIYNTATDEILGVEKMPLTSN